jgi:hypothetical protein
MAKTGEVPTIKLQPPVVIHPPPRIEKVPVPKR